MAAHGATRIMVNGFDNPKLPPARVRHALAITALLSVLSVAAVAHFAEPQKPGDFSSVPPSPALSLKDFRFPDQHGTVVDKSSLNGHVWIADFIFTTCTSACPLLTSRLVTVQRRLPDASLRFVSFSVDPARDTEAELAKYAARWAQTEQRWQLLRTTEPALAALSAGLGIGLDRVGGEIIHSSRLFLVDAQGTLAGSFDSGDDAELNRLVLRTRELLGAPSSPSAADVMGGTGGALFANLGCAGCHADPQLAPPLGGLSGSHAMLERGGAVLVDDAYVRESIADPGAKLVAGYPSSMPNYGPLLSSEQLTSLVAYVRSLPAQPITDSASATAAQTDPVCGMAVRVTPQTPSASYQGKTYHFCSPSCSQRFNSNPQKYLQGAHASPP